MGTYYTKCGRTFTKLSQAETTGYHVLELENSNGETNGIEDEICRECPFVIKIKEGWADKERHKRFECRAGNNPPNTENSYDGSSDDMRTLKVKSLHVDFCEEILNFAENHCELTASYNQDLNDCRRSISISCSQNKNGMVAKQELIDKFFSVDVSTKHEVEPELETKVSNSAVESVVGFDYSLVDEETADYLHQKTLKIFEIKMKSDMLIGKELLEVHGKLANNKNGTFEKYVESLGISHKTARNYINRYEYVLKNFQDISDAESIQPSLLLEISKSSAPPELQAAVLTGDITTHKEYLEIKRQLEQSESKAQELNKKLFEAQLKTDPHEVESLKYQIEQRSKESETFRGNADHLTEQLKLEKQRSQELLDALKSQPIEATVAEIKEVVPDALGLTLVKNMIGIFRQLEDFTAENMEFMVSNVGLIDLSKHGLQVLIIEAQGKLNEIIELIED